MIFFHQTIKVLDPTVSSVPQVYIYLDYPMVGLTYGFYPRVTDVMSQTSKVRASE